MRPAYPAILSSMLFSANIAYGGDAMDFSLKSPDFNEGESIPKRFSCEGEDISPELVWEDPPPGTKSFALIVEDPDAPMGTFVHWIIYDLPPASKKLRRGAGTEELSDGIKQGSTDFDLKRYGGPCPPKGHGKHRYNFLLRALDIATLGLPAGAKKSEVERAMKGHILAETKITGLYQR